MVLRDSGSPRCGCLEDLEETESGALDRLFLPHPCRDDSDSEAVCRRTHKTRTPLVVESLGDTANTDSDECDYVHTGRCDKWPPVEMERLMVRCWVESGC